MDGLSVRDLTVRYGAVVAVDQVSVAVGPGEIVGLMGANGAGKTSFVDAVTGFIDPADGEVRFDGRDVTGLSPHRLATAGLRRTFQNLRLFEDLTVSENLTVAAERERGTGLLRDLVAPRRTRTALDRTLERVGIAEFRDERPRSLPAGTRRLVDVARAVVAEPDVLLLDEPAAGLDTTETAALAQLLRRLAEDGMGLLLIEHDTALVFEVSDRVVAIDFGREIARGTPAEIRRDPAVMAAYLGEETDTDEDRDGQGAA